VGVQRGLAAFLTLGAVFWAAVILVAPRALAGETPVFNRLAASVYHSAGLICHQRAERSFHLAGVQQPVCARCAGLYFSGALGALAAWFAASRSRASRKTRSWLLVAALPTALTVGLEAVGLLHTSNLLRALSALPLGASAGWIFIQSLRAEAAAGEVRSRDGCYDARGI
jgi:uncharacterized membrane protein